MEWREIDTMMVSKCIQFIEKEISEGKLEASHFIPVPELKEARLKYVKTRCCAGTSCRQNDGGT